MRLVLLAPLALGLALGGCGPEEDLAARTEALQPPPDHGEVPDDALGAAVHALGLEKARRYAPHEAGVLRGNLRRGRVQEHPVVLLGTHCYVVVGAGDEGVEDLDLVLVNPAGQAVLHDAEAGRESWLGVSDAICPNEPGLFRVRARMFRGGGEYALRVYGRSMI